MNPQNKYKTYPEPGTVCHHPRGEARVIGYHNGWDEYVCAWCGDIYWRENSARTEGQVDVQLQYNGN